MTKNLTAHVEAGSPSAIIISSRYSRGGFWRIFLLIKLGARGVRLFSIKLDPLGKHINHWG